MTRWLNQLQPWGILLLRIVLGLAMLNHAIPKLLHLSGAPFRTLHIDSTPLARIAGVLGLPHWFGTFSAFTELIGGLLLILGLLTRFAAFLVIIDLLLSLIFYDIPYGYIASEYTLALTAIAFLLLLTGPGRAALDRKLGLT